MTCLSGSDAVFPMQKFAHITWLKTVQNDLKSHNLTLTEALDTAQNGPL